MNRLLLTAIAVISLSVSSLAQDGRAIDVLAKQIIKVVKHLDTTNATTYIKHMIELEDIHEMVELSSIGEEEKEMVLGMISEKDITERHTRNFYRLVNDIQNTGINWKGVKYEEFLYRLRMDDGVKELKGDIYLQEGENHYKMQVMAAFIEGEYELLELTRLKVSYELNGYPEGYDPDAEAEAAAEEMVRAMEEAMKEMEAEEIDEKQLEEDQKLINRIEEAERQNQEQRRIVYEEADAQHQDREQEATIIFEEDLYQPDSNIPVQEEIIDFPDISAEFPGGNEAMMQFIMENIVYPTESIELGEQGKVYTSFVVEADGSITNIQIMRGVSPELDKEAKRVIALMPKWTPAESGGKKIRAMVRVPINFELSSGEENK